MTCTIKPIQTLSDLVAVVRWYKQSNDEANIASLWKTMKDVFGEIK